jgi:heterodisulfide reductase subunit C
LLVGPATLVVRLSHWYRTIFMRVRYEQRLQLAQVQRRLDEDHETWKMGLLTTRPSVVFHALSDPVRSKPLAPSETTNLTTAKRDPAFADSLIPEGRLLRRCIQCATCTSSCPAAHAMDLSPHQMWRMVQYGLADNVLHSKTMWLCSLCYRCQVRCPRGIPLTETITRLKEVALQRGMVHLRESVAFYRAFNLVIRRYGRVREMEFMVRFFLGGNPLSALGFARLGVLMLARGKVHPELPRLSGPGRLDRLYERVAELEARA